MTGLIACLDALERIKHPSDLTFRRDGKGLAATISPATREAGQSHASRIWRFDLAGGSGQLTFGPGCDALQRIEAGNQASHDSTLQQRTG